MCLSQKLGRGTLPAVRVGRVLTTGLLCLAVGSLACQGASAASGSTQIPSGHITLLGTGAFPYIPPPKGDASIRGFGFAATVSGDACAPTVGIEGDAVSAVPGDMVCVFSLSFGYAIQPWVDTAGQHVPGMSGSVTDGVTNAPITAGELFVASTSEFAISVPEGSDAVLNLSDAGFTQSYSLTEKKRVGVSPPILYRDPTYWEVRSSQVTWSILLHDVGVSDDKTATVELALPGYDLTYFRPDDPLIRPPAPSEAFLAVGFSYDDEAGPSGDTFSDFRTLSGTAVQLRLPDGRVEDSTPIANLGTGLLAATYVFVVPANFSRGSVLIHPGVMDGRETAITGSYVQNEEVAFGTATIPIGGGRATSTPAIIAHTTSAGPVAPKTKAGHGRAPVAGGGGVPLGIPIGGGTTLLVLVLVIPIWRRNKHGREIVVYFPVPVGSGTTAVVDAVAATEDVDDQGGADGPTVAASDEAAASEPLTQRRLTARLLGDVEVEPDVGVASGRSKVAVLLVYLVLNAGKEVTSAELREALSIAPSTLANYVRRLRRELGEEVLTSTRRSAKYRYVGEIECDWASFEDLVARARFAGDDEQLVLLQEALGLVRGQPFGRDPQYDWADQTAREMQGAVRQAATKVATTLWEPERQGEVPAGAARGAAHVGLLADPVDHDLHRLRLECCAGDFGAIEDAWADTSKRIGDGVAGLRPLYRKLIGMAAFMEGEKIAGP
jgi:hypothetical protein